MGLFSRFENKMEDGLEGAAGRMFDAPISPVQISKKADRAMRREKMVGAGKQYAPTLYTVLVNPQDDARLFGYYPTLAGETETYLRARAMEEGLVMDGAPLVRFIVDDDLRKGKFDIIAEMVSAPIIEQLRAEEMQRYGIAPGPGGRVGAQGAPIAGHPGSAVPYGAPIGAAVAPQAAAPSAAYPISNAAAPQGAFDAPGIPAAQAAPARPAIREPLPYVPEDEIDRSIDYGEYTFDSRDFDAPEQGADLSGLDVSTPLEYASAPTGAPSVPAAAQPAPSQATSMPAGFFPARLIHAETSRSWKVTSAQATIGRSSASAIALDDISASRTHASLHFVDGGWFILDEGSTNGTFVNGRRVSQQPLAHGDRITIGRTELVYSAS